jgi:molybdopterin converting factor small subunit
MTDVTPRIPVTVRFFAAASAAAGSDSAVLTIKAGATVDDAIGELSGQSDKLALVLQKCSYLCDGMAVRDRTTVLRAHQTLDILPPFSGG